MNKQVKSTRIIYDGNFVHSLIIYTDGSYKLTRDKRDTAKQRVLNRYNDWRIR